MIFALATPVAQSAIAVFRISGEGCCQKFNSVVNKPISDYRKVFLRDVVWEGVLVDRCSIVYYSSPSSYTGEDSIEVFCHGGLSVIKSLTEVFLSLGFREAVPGEFSRIAFENGKLSLNEAEAVVDLIKAEVTKRLPPCEFYFPDDYVTDRSMRFMAAEVIREKLMRFMGEELPYSVTVEIEQFKWQENGVWHINGLILVERETQKRMVIGNKGEKLKVIGREARKDLEEMLDNKVFLELWVKVKSGWADDERALRSLGYGED